MVMPTGKGGNKYRATKKKMMVFSSPSYHS